MVENISRWAKVNYRSVSAEFPSCGSYPAYPDRFSPVASSRKQSSRGPLWRDLSYGLDLRSLCHSFFGSHSAVPLSWITFYSVGYKFKVFLSCPRTSGPPNAERGFSIVLLYWLFSHRMIHETHETHNILKKGKKRQARRKKSHKFWIVQPPRAGESHRLDFFSFYFALRFDLMRTETRKDTKKFLQTKSEEFFIPLRTTRNFLLKKSFFYGTTEVYQSGD